MFCLVSEYYVYFFLSTLVILFIFYLHPIYFHFVMCDKPCFIKCICLIIKIIPHSHHEFLGPYINSQWVQLTICNSSLKNIPQQVYIIFYITWSWTTSSMANGANKSAVEKVWSCFLAEEAEIDYFTKAETR